MWGLSRRVALRRFQSMFFICMHSIDTSIYKKTTRVVADTAICATARYVHSAVVVVQTSRYPIGRLLATCLTMYIYLNQVMIKLMVELYFVHSVPLVNTIWKQLQITRTHPSMCAEFISRLMQICILRCCNICIVYFAGTRLSLYSFVTNSSLQVFVGLSAHVYDTSKQSTLAESICHPSWRTYLLW